MIPKKAKAPEGAFEPTARDEPVCFIIRTIRVKSSVFIADEA